MSKKSSALPPALTYRARQLHMEQVSLDRLDRRIPARNLAYVYSRARLLENYHRFDDAFQAP